jgi:hypothetical protein
VVDPAAPWSPLTEWWQRRSLRSRVTLGATVVVAVGVSLIAAGILLGLQRSLLAALDDTLVQRARDVAALAAQGTLRRPIPSAADTATVQLLDAAGTPVASTRDVEGEGAIVAFPLPQPLAAGTPTSLTGLPVGEGSDYRVLALPAQLDGRPVTVIAATSLAQQQRSLADLATGLALGLPVLIALVIGPPHRSDQ